jgi:hypothetical protein
MRDRAAAGIGARHRPIFAGIFGLVHGAGFAGYLKSLFVANIALPLLGFNIGIELGQLVVLLAAAAAFLLVDGSLRRLSHRFTKIDAFQLRLIAVSASITLVATGWAWERYPR